LAWRLPESQAPEPARSVDATPTPAADEPPALPADEPPLPRP
jgi:hypothetical protein